MNNRPASLEEVARKSHNGEEFSFLLREFLDEFYDPESWRLTDTLRASHPRSAMTDWPMPI